jgi:hypothetical protein
MGISALSFFGGVKGADAFVQRIKDDTGLDVTVGSHATAAAIAALGGIKRIALLTPYWPVMNTEVKRYFGDAGLTVVGDIALQCTSWTAIAAVTPAECRDAIRRLDSDDVDARPARQRHPRSHHRLRPAAGGALRLIPLPMLKGMGRGNSIRLRPARQRRQHLGR